LVKKNSYNESMRLFIKRFFNFFLLLLILLSIFSFNVFSQEPTPTPEEGTLGGKCKSANIDISQITIPKISGPEDSYDKWGCIDLLFVKLFCVSDILSSSQKSAVDFLDRVGVLSQFSALGVCEPGLEPSTLDIKDPNCICINPNDKDLARISDILCNRYIDQEKPASEKLKSKEFVSCSNCFANGGYWSGLGCIYFSNWQTFFEKNVFGLLIGLAGIISLFCIIYAAFQIQTSSGNAEKVKKAQELLTSCIMGLMLIIFSVFILKLIGVDILKIPGFSSK